MNPTIIITELFSFHSLFVLEFALYRQSQTRNEITEFVSTMSVSFLSLAIFQDKVKFCTIFILLPLFLIMELKE